MAAKYYYVTTSGQRELDALYENEGSLFWWGKTADLQVKIEPEKTVELDSGDSVVGSFKISISFTMLEHAAYVPKDSYLHLLPVDSNGEIITIALRHFKDNSHKAMIEHKTGEFQKWHYSLSCKLPVEMLSAAIKVWPLAIGTLCCLFVDNEDVERVWDSDGFEVRMSEVPINGKMIMVPSFGWDEGLLVKYVDVEDPVSTGLPAGNWVGYFYLGPDRMLRKIG